MKRRGDDGGMAAMGRLLRSGTAAGISDGQLLERFASRHDEAAEAAFAAIVERHGPMVLGVCRRVLADAHDAQDAFQATFLVLVGRAESLGRVDSLGSWLFGVARRVAARSRSAAARRREVERRASARGEPAEEAAEDRGEVWDEVGRLPDRLRDPVLLCYLEGLTHEQAAARLGWPVGTVRSRLARARDRLRRALARKGFEPPRGGTGLLGLLPAAGRVPASLSTATVEAAMKLTARDAFEAGLASASVASLTEGVLKAMTITKIQGAVAAFAATTLITVSAYAFQVAGGPPKEAEAAAKPETQAARSLSVAPPPAGGRQGGTAGPTYLEAIEQHARDASHAQEVGKVGTAIEHTREIERLSLRWREDLSHQASAPALVVLDGSGAPPPNATAPEPAAGGGLPANVTAPALVVLDGSGAPPPNATAPEPAAGGGLPANVTAPALDPSQVGLTTVVDPTTGAPPMGYGGMGQDPAGELRLRRLEQKLDQILQALGRQKPDQILQSAPPAARPGAAPTALPTPARN